MSNDIDERVELNRIERIEEPEALARALFMLNEGLDNPEEFTRDMKYEIDNTLRHAFFPPKDDE